MATTTSANTNATSTTAAQAKSSGGFKCLNDQIATSQSFCLNANPQFPFANLFQGDHTLVLKSDADEQLILQIEFQDAVKLHSIQLVAPQADAAPMIVKLYANRPNLGFSDANDVEPTQLLELMQEKTNVDTAAPVELRFVKFQRVKTLTIFVEENYGADETILSSLKLFGDSIAGTNMNELKKISDE